MKENLEKLLSTIQKDEDLHEVEEKTLKALNKMAEGQDPEEVVLSYIKEKTL